MACGRSGHVSRRMTIFATALQRAFDAREHLRHHGRLGQQGDAEVVAVGDVEAGTRNDQDVFALQQMQGKRLVVELWKTLRVDARKRVQGTRRERKSV